jgi:hypothetical protein
MRGIADVPSYRSADQRILCRDSNRILGPMGISAGFMYTLIKSGGPIP